MSDIVPVTWIKKCDIYLTFSNILIIFFFFLKTSLLYLFSIDSLEWIKTQVEIPSKHFCGHHQFFESKHFLMFLHWNVDYKTIFLCCLWDNPLWDIVYMWNATNMQASFYEKKVWLNSFINKSLNCKFKDSKMQFEYWSWML